MEFGIALATAADSWKIVRRAEELGYAHAWFFDTHLLNAELFVAMGAAAVQTQQIRLGTGVMIPSSRIAPVAASGLASLNRLAPGRIDFGISPEFGPTEIFPPVDAMHRAIPVSADRAAPAGLAHPREKPASRRGRAKSRETWTLRWREVDSNY